VLLTQLADAYIMYVGHPCIITTAAAAAAEGEMYANQPVPV